MKVSLVGNAANSTELKLINKKIEKIILRIKGSFHKYYKFITILLNFCDKSSF